MIGDGVGNIGLKSDFVGIPYDGVNESISNSVAIDVYVMSPNDNASIRVDLP